jgi:hypothetical protein
MSKIENFTILGERNTGTHFLQFSLLSNFQLNYLRNIKHFFGFVEPLNHENLLTICVVRNPIDWIDSFFKRHHHVSPENLESIDAFLTNNFYSIHEVGENINKEIMEDRHIYTKNRYKNIFEMRKVKNFFLTSEMKKKVKNYILIRYEDLRDNYDVVLDFIKNKFNLTQKHKVYKKIDTYKGTKKELFIKKNVTLTSKIIKVIKNNLDLEQEKSIGYLL